MRSNLGNGPTNRRNGFARVGLTAVLFLGLGLTPAFAGVVPWQDDPDAARTTAEAQSKHLLWFFTGSDWCVYCQKLDANVFSSTEVATEIQKHFVPLILDFPRLTEVDPEVLRRNRKLAAKYGVRGYPTVILTTAEGLPFAAFAGASDASGRPFVPETFNAFLEDARKAHQEVEAFIASADAAGGVKEIQYLRLAVERLKKQGVSLSFYEPLNQRIVDRVDALVAHPDADAKMRQKLLNEKAIALGRLGRTDEALAQFEEALQANPVGDDGADVLVGKAMLQERLGQYAAGAESMERAAALATDSSLKQVLLLQRGKYLLLDRNFDDALIALDAAVSADPAGRFVATALLYKGQALIVRERFEEAVQVLEDALSRTSAAGSPLAQQILFLQGRAYEEMKEVDKAVDAYQRALNLDPKSALAPQLRMLLRGLKPAPEETEGAASESE